MAKRTKGGTADDSEMPELPGAAAAAAPRGKDRKDKETDKKGAGKGGKKTGKYKLSQTEVYKALPVLAKATCSSLQAARELEGTANDVMLFEATRKIPMAMKAATKMWQDKATEIGKGHGQGPPRLLAWAAFLAALKTEDVGGTAKAALQTLEDTLKSQSVQQQLLAVRLCKTKITYDQKFSKVTLSVRGELESSRPLILEAAKQAGAEIKQGKAPPSGLERQLQQLLAAWAEAEEA